VKETEREQKSVEQMELDEEELVDPRYEPVCMSVVVILCFALPAAAVSPQNKFVTGF
jgi:hypothetical protein